MDQNEFEDLLNKGIEAAESGSVLSSVEYLNQASKHRKSPVVQSYRAYCLAIGGGHIRDAAKLCKESINQDRSNSLHYLIMGRLLLMSGDRTKAIKVFRLGLKASPNALIITELKKLGLRKPPSIDKLTRNHPLNRFLGKTFTVLGLR